MPVVTEAGRFHVQSEQVAHIFRSPLEIERLMHFMQPGGSSVSVFARSAGLTVNAAYRKVQRYEGYGLVRQVAQRQRAGKAVKIYVCPFHSFFVPERFVPVHEQVTEVFSPIQEMMHRSLSETVRAEPNPVGGLIFRFTPHGLWMLPATPAGDRWRPDEPGTPVTVHGSGPLLLNYADAQALQRELHELFDRYRQKRGHTLYLLHQFLTPVVMPSQQFAFPHTGYTDLV